MDAFELTATVVGLLKGKDADVWHDVLERTVSGQDPYASQLSRLRVVEVLRTNDLDPKDLLDRLAALEVKVDERIVIAFRRMESEPSEKSLFIYTRAARQHEGQMIVRFDPGAFGLPLNSYEEHAFGFDGTVGYDKVLGCAQKYGLRPVDFLGALYLRLHFLEAHKSTGGTRYYIGCKPIIYDEGELPIIPALSYDPYAGWSLDAFEAGPESTLDVGVLSGQGEYHESTFLFYLDPPR